MSPSLMLILVIVGMSCIILYGSSITTNEDSLVKLYDTHRENYQSRKLLSSSESSSSESTPPVTGPVTGSVIINSETSGLYTLEVVFEVYLAGNQAISVCPITTNEYVYTLTNSGNSLFAIIGFELYIVSDETVVTAGHVDGPGTIAPDLTTIESTSIVWTFLAPPISPGQSSESLFVCSTLLPGTNIDNAVNVTGEFAFDASSTIVGPFVEVSDTDSDNDSDDSNDEMESDAIEMETVENETDEIETSDYDNARTNGKNNFPDMFGIKNAKPTETYSILSVIIIAGIVVLIVMSWCIYQYIVKRKLYKAVNELNEIQANKNEDNDKKVLHKTKIVIETS